MKSVSISVLTCAALALNSQVLAQKITYQIKDAPIEDVFKVIKSQTDYIVFSNAELIKKIPNVSIQANSMPLEKFLDQVLSGSSISYSIDGQTIILTQSKSEQGRVVFKGVVVDNAGHPLVGATVKNMMNERVEQASTNTGNNGSFNILAKKGDVLVVSYVGYKTYQYGVSLLSVTPTFQLTSEERSLEELVVIGYGSAKKKDLTGSVASLSGKSMQDLPFMTVDNALAGKVAGVEVSKADGTPGGAVRIRIRGTSSLLGGNDPLYIIDGVPVQVQNNYISPGYDISSPTANDINGSGASAAGLSASFVNGLNGLNGLNPEDIASISVLKDASSAAIYGSKASNGVVIITTKRGANNMHTNITAGYYTTITAPRLPAVLNATQYREMVTEGASNSYHARQLLNQDIPAELDMILNNPSRYFGTANTNWLKEVTRNTLSHNADLSIQGGGQSSKFYTSLSYNNTPGVMKGSKYERVSGKINLEYNLGKKLAILTNLGLSNTDQDITNGAYAQAIRARPDWAPRDANGNYTDFSMMGESYNGFQNPLALISAINNSKTFSLMGSLSGIYTINPDLNFKSTVSLNRQAYDQRTFTPSYVAVGGYAGNTSGKQATGSNASSTLYNWFVENVLTFNKQLNEQNSINVVAGTSYETYKRSFFSTTATGYPDDTHLTSLSSAITPLYVSGDNPIKPQSYLVSFYLRGNYTYDNKYLFTFTGRTDGSSKFGADNKWGYFPSGAFAWRLSEEKFLKDISWISDIKLRSSYGLLGNQNIGDQMHRTLYYPLSYGGSSALVPSQLGNAGIKWETTHEFDLGADLAFFNNRLQFTFDYYDKRTKGALLSLPVAPSTSYPNLLSNSVDIKNTGYEVSIDGVIKRSAKFSWSGTFNISWNRSMISKLSADAPLGQLGNYAGLESGNTTLVEGKPLGLITGRYVEDIIRTQAQLDAYKASIGSLVGIFYPYMAIGDAQYTLQPESGGVRFVSKNEIIAEAAPKFYGGLSQNLSYGKLGVQLYFTYSYGGKLLWGDHVSSVQMVQKANATTAILDRYTENNTTGSSPRLMNGSDVTYLRSNLDVFSSSFLKLRTFMVNYDFSQTGLSRSLHTRNLTAFVSATNLFTVTKYPGNDPETSNDPYSSIGGYFDASNYPVTRTFSFGLKASF